MIKISQVQKEKIKKTAQKNRLVFAVLFGSTITGKRSQESDLDIAVLTKKKPDYKLFKKLFADFSDIFRGENVDVRFLNEADSLFRFQVIKNGFLLHGDKEQFQEYSSYAYKSYIDDALPLFDLQRKILYRKQKELERAIL